MNTVNKDALLTSVASNPVLFLQLKEKSPAERVELLLDTVKALPSVEGMSDGKLDHELVPYLNYLFTAIEMLPEAAADRRKYRLAAAAQLFLWFTDTTIAFTSKVLFPKIPNTFTRLSSEMAGSWVEAETEDEARECLMSIANLYLKTGSDAECRDWRQAIRTAVNRSSRELSPQRLANAVITLSEITTWNFGESIFDSIAIARVKKMIELRPGFVAFDAKVQRALGAECSDTVQDAVIEYASLAGKLDETGRSFRRHEPNAQAGDIVGFDTKTMTAIVAIVVPELPYETGVMDMARAIEANAKTWVNPHCGETHVRIEWRKGRAQGDVFHDLTVGGVHPTKKSAA